MAIFGYTLLTFSPSSLLEPTDVSVLGSSVKWLEGTMLGSAATATAIIAVAWIGMLALSGRIDVRRGLSTILGCFLIFGAPGIVAGLMALAEVGAAGAGPPQFAPIVQSSPPRSPLPPLAPYDPYAGASVPTRQ